MSDRTRLWLYLCAITTSLNALVSAGFSIATIYGKPVADIAALYAVARSVPLAIAAVLVGVLRSYRGLLVMGPLMALVQLCDAVIGAISHNTEKTLGPVFLGVLTIFAVVMLASEHRENRYSDN